MDFDSRQLRQVLGAFPTGVTVVTTIDDAGKPYGVTANSFSSVSLDPPLILWSQSMKSTSHHAFRDAERFVVNIMADDQVHVANQFAKSGDDKFSGIAVRPGLGGVPIIDGSAAYLECVKVAAYPGGDHTVFIGKVEHIDRAPRDSLAFGDGRYKVTFAHDLGGRVAGVEGASTLQALEAVRLASAALPQICEEIGQRTLGLAVWGSHGPTIVRWEASQHPVSPHLQTGVVVSLTQSATGRAFAAFMDADSTAAAVARELESRAVSGDPDNGRLACSIAESREHGIARAVGAAPSQRHQVIVNAFSAPVFDASGQMVLALSTTCRADLLAPEWNGPVPAALLQAARKLSARLGHSPVRRGTCVPTN
ncbi:flavin reductase [Variovorax saccharolyticus]|uniref:flavin reductase n=1 Tax=Variovorax saccharolyticus TaxID=3053516 RepID=UPI002575ED70|nr:flavin reductase [Variovorax sp. J31P216]MDM0026667.1 flavin reductase [Variovorax sp. J31P216]